jgi:hypothetical protein
MKVKLLLLLATLVIASLMIGCSGNGLFLASNDTNVNLEGPNYKIVATNVTGHSSAGYLLGFSFSVGAFTESFALVRVSGTGKHYQEALNEFWNNFEKQYGSVEGRALGLINVRYDADVLNTFFYTESRIYVTADVIEFQ